MEILAKYTHSQAQTTPAGHQWAERGSVTPNTCKKAESVKRSPYQMLINHTGAKDVLQRNSKKQGQE
jgi:hypothetical protein